MQAGAAAPIDVTVAISTCGRPDRLVRCVTAVLSGVLLPRQLVIVDQSHDDRTASAIRSAGWERMVRLEYVRSHRNGLGASRNTAIAHCSSRIVLFTDDDCVPHSEWLSAIVDAFAALEPPDFVTGRVLPLDDGEPGRQPVSTRTRTTAARFRGVVMPWLVGTGGNVAIDRDWLARVGGFTEQLGAGSPGQSAEDMDLFYRLLRAGARARYEPAAIVYHERKSEAGTLRRASSYGFGMGAFCGMRARAGDAYAWWLGARWCADRVGMLAAACCLGRRTRAAYEIRALAGAWRGVAYGLGATRDEAVKGEVVSPQCEVSLK